MKTLKFNLVLFSLLFGFCLKAQNYYYNVNGGYLSIPATGNINSTSFTIEGQFFFLSTGTQALFGKGDGGGSTNNGLLLLVGVTAAGSLDLWDGFAWQATGLTVNANEWTYIALRVDLGSSTTANVYKRSAGGSLQSANVNVNLGSTSGFELEIGDQGNCNCNRFGGYVDEVRVWNNSSIDVTAIDDVPVSTSSTNLVAYYNFDGLNTNNLATNTSFTTTPPSLLNINAFGSGFGGPYTSPIFDSDSDGLLDNVDPCPNDAANICAATEPTTQATGINITNNNNQSTVDVNFSRGNGSEVIVAAAQVSSGSPSITDGTGYTASATLGAGSSLGGGWFVVYRGTGTSFTLSGLSAGNDYRIIAFENNSTYNNYLLSEGSNAITFNTILPNGYSVATGNWSSTATWSNGVVPTSLDSVFIQSGHTVTLDQSIDVSRMEIEGTLTMDDNNMNIAGDFISSTGILNQNSTELITLDPVSAGTYTLAPGSGFLPDLTLNPTASVTYNLTTSAIFDTQKTLSLIGPVQLDISGQSVFLTGSAAGVNQTNGSLNIGAAGALNLSNDASYTQSGGSLYIQGTAGSEAYLTASTGNWAFNSTGGSVIAEHFVISGTSGDGMEFSGSASILSPYFSDGTFTSGTGTAYITLNNTAMEQQRHILCH